MKDMLVGIDTAKTVFEVAVSEQPGRVRIQKRLSRDQLVLFMSNLGQAVVVMEACGSSHWWARRFEAMGHRVVLLPPHCVKPYVRRNKTDRTDAKALLEAYRNDEIKAVPAKSPEQQMVMGLHSVRSAWMGQRVRTINMLRGLLREQGHFIRVGARHAAREAWLIIEDANVPIPAPLRRALAALCEEIHDLERRIKDVERELEAVASESDLIRRLRELPGVGLLTATALAGYVGDFHRFPTARHFGSYLGITPREHSSGARKRLGHISKMGSPYLRTLLIHGARTALLAAKRAKEPNALQAWALDVQRRRNHNVATVALANKLARIAWAVATRDTAYVPPPLRSAA